jgi:hypothetical protein
MANLELVKGIVKYQAGKILNTVNGKRINIVITLASGENITIWGNPDDEIKRLKKNEEVQLVKDARGFKLLSEPKEAEPQRFETREAEEIHIKSSQVKELGLLLSNCVDRVEKLQPKLAAEEQIKLAISLFIQVSKC